MTAQLLVSVRSPEEAMSALAGGADIIDIKEPSHGSLGAASPEVMEQIIQRVQQTNPAAVVSAAMGEVRDHKGCTDSAVSVVGHTIRQLNFVKCGLSGLTTENQATEWKASWAHFRHRYVGSVDDMSWVAVSYADWQRSNSPSPMDVLAEGSAIGLPILLVDTFMKDDTTLLDWISAPQLTVLRKATRAAGMKLALAGRINDTMLPSVCRYAPDIVAIRGAACEQGDRTSTVTARRVEVFRTRLSCLHPTTLPQQHIS